MYDIIGDVHGYADKLVALLTEMGYTEVGGVFRHTGGSRQAVFVGDLIDRGPQIERTLEIVSAMVAAGSAQAVLGNHEFNAIGFHTRNPADDGWLRSHNAGHRRQHGATLAAFADRSFDRWVAWFRTLPLYLDLGEIRVVHACWDSWAVATLTAARARHGGLTTEFMVAALTKGSAGDRDLRRAVEWTLKGKEVPLAAGMAFHDHEGKSRRGVRVRWFAQSSGDRYCDYVFPPRTDIEGLDAVIPPASLAALRMEPDGMGYYPADAPPVFFGHYWLRAENDGGQQRDNVICLDYGVARRGGGPLCGYRFGVDEKPFVVVP